MYPNTPLCPTTRCAVLQKIFGDRNHIFVSLLKRLKYLIFWRSNSPCAMGWKGNGQG